MVKSNRYSEHDYIVRKYLCDGIGFIYLGVSESKEIQENRTTFMKRSDAGALGRYLKFNNLPITENENIQFIKDKKIQFGTHCIELNLEYGHTPDNIEIVYADSRYLNNDTDNDSFNRIIRCGNIDAVTTIFNSYKGKIDNYFEHDMLVNSYYIYQDMIYLFAACDEEAFLKKIWSLRSQRDDHYVDDY
jgi:hypothetical protein